MQNLGGETFLFTQQAQQQVLRANVFVIQALGLFGAIGQHALALMAQRKIHGSRNLFADGGVSFNLLPDRFDGGVRAQKTIRQRLVFAQQPQQKVFRLDVRAPKLASLIPREENYSARLFGITFKHDYRRLSTLSVVLDPADSVETRRRTREPEPLDPIGERDRTGSRTKCCV